MRGAAQLAQLAVDELGALGVEAGERLVEQEQLGLVQERAAEREPLHHAAREVGYARAPLVPEAEALEQHADALAPLADAVEASVELEVLERRQLAVERASSWLRKPTADRGASTSSVAGASGPPDRRRAAAASSCRRRSAR